MGAIRCHRCGESLPEGSTKYQVDLRVRSMFDGVIPEAEHRNPEQELDKILSDLSAYTEEELNRQVYEDDVFILCPACKEAFLEEVYSHIHAKASPEAGRAHMIH